MVQLCTLYCYASGRGVYRFSSQCFFVLFGALMHCLRSNSLIPPCSSDSLVER